MIKDRIDDLIEKYRKCIKDDLLIIENNRRYLEEKEIELFKEFIKSLEYAKTGEFND